MTPAVSIIIPVYNPGDFLRMCLDSLLAQSLADFEAICVNDASTDGSLAVLQEYASRDARIKIIDSKVNRGAATSRNEAIALAKGEYLAFVDSDDSIDPDFLEKLYTRAMQTGADIVKGERRFYEPSTGGTSPDDRFMANMHHKVKKNKAAFINAFTTGLYKTSLIRGHEVHFLDGVVFFEDSFFTIMATIFNVKTEVVDGTFYNYTRNPSSVCSKGVTPAYVQNRIQGATAIMDLFDKFPVSKEHYLTVYDYLFLEMTVLCRNINLTDAITRVGAQGLMLVLDRCKYPEELVYRYFMEFKMSNRSSLFNHLRKLRETKPTQ